MDLGLVRKRVKMLSISLLAIMALESNVIQYLGEELIALAAPQNTVTSGIAFPYGGAEEKNSKYYAAASYLSGGLVNITNIPTGNVIKKITHNGEDITPPSAIGVKDYSGPINDTHSGTSITVTSIGNESAQGYYAWYRYLPGGSQGSNWYADVFDQYGSAKKISCGPDNFGPAAYHKSARTTTPEDTINGYQMTRYPGCHSADFSSEIGSLSMSAVRDADRGYKTSGGVEVPDSVVTGVTATKAEVNNDISLIISGPNGKTGTPRSSAISNVSVTPNANNAGEYRVKFHQDFTDFVDGFDSMYEIPPTNIARVATYYSAFLVDLQGSTYEYDSEVIVEYEPPPNAPNLSSVAITAPSCVEAGKPATFSFSFSNTGGSAITTAFTAKVMVDGSLLQTYNYTGLAATTPKNETFTKTFAGTSMYSVGVFIDTVPGESNTGDNSKLITITPVARCAATPIPEQITGSFTLDKTTMPYGDDNWAMPVNVTVNGTDGSGNSCKISRFGFIFEQDGLIADGVVNTSSPSPGSFAGPPYPRGMGEGTVNVTMKIFSSCGGSKIVGPQPFTITLAAGNNNPPFFQPGFFTNHNTNNFPAIDEVVVGSMIDLGIIKDKTRTPNEPYDPEGDGFYFNWDFKGSSDPWIRNLADTSVGYGFNELAYDGDTYRNIRADVLGMHTVSVTASDTRGAKSGRRSAIINIVKPNPIPMCSAPSEVKANHPLAPNVINADKSRSPMGRTIDHSKDVWTNKLSSYENNSLADITVSVTLEKIYDSAGLASEDNSTCNIIVHPDYPPIAKINAPALGIRGEDYDILNESYSTDGDTITQVLWQMKYDKDNDGDLNEEAWESISGDLYKSTFNPTKIGKYQFKLRAVEEFGAYAEAESTIMDVTNQAPEVSFDLTGNGPNPDSNPPTIYKSGDIMANWPLVATNTNNALSKLPTYNWQEDNGTLATGAGKGKESQIAGVNIVSTPAGIGTVTAYTTQFNDNGLGRNGLSIYKAMTAPTSGYSQPLFYPKADGTPGNWVSGATPISSDKTHLYFTGTASYDNPAQIFYALNKNKIGRYSQEFIMDGTPCSGCFATFTLKHFWLDGSPYDYILNRDSLPTGQLASTRDVPVFINSSNTGTTIKMTDIVGATVQPYLAEKTVYLVFSKSVPVKYTTYTGGDDGDVSYPQYTNGYGACSYKALTGTLIACFDAPGVGVKMTLTKDDHLLILTDSGGSYSANGYFGDGFYEVDLYGNIVKTGTIPTNNPTTYVTYEKKYVQWPQTETPRSFVPAQYDTASCSFAQAQQPYKDNLGNTYFYETKTCRDSAGNAMTPTDRNVRFFPELALGVYVAKYDKNFKVVWRSRTGGNNLSFSAAWTYDWQNNINTMIVNSTNNTILTRTLYSVAGSWGDTYSTVNNVIDMTTGGVWAWGGVPFNGMSKNMHVDAWGNYQSGWCAATIYNQCSNIQTGGNSFRVAGTLGFFSSATETIGERGITEYVGDGLLLSSYMIHSWVTGYNSPPYGDTVYWIDKGPVDNAPPVNIQRYQYGQFISPNVLNDAELTFNFKTEQNKIDTNLFGYSFRMQDGTNRYALEFDGVTMFLSKYINGVRTVISSSPYNIQDSKSYNVRIRTAGNMINVWVNKVNYFSDIIDESFPVSGKFGAFSDKSFVQYSVMTTKAYVEADLWAADYAILDEKTNLAELKYDNIKFDDPELDPIAGSFAWTYTHTPMFLNNGGLSPLSGQSFTTGQPIFDRVGKWDISLKAKDDPYPALIYKFPSMVFDSYRKNSNTFKKTITVHRRPVAAFTAVMQPNGVIAYTTENYDPDRFDYSTLTPDVGYETNRGIIEERWYYITPDGNVVNSKLDRVNDSGTYTIVLQVKDEYGAWSWPVSEIIDVAARPNNPPSVSLIYPGGSVDKPDYFCVGCNATINWSQTDVDPDTTFTAFEIYIGRISKDMWGTVTEYEMSSGVKAFSSKDSVYSYIASTVTGDINYKYRIRVRVKDEVTWSQWSNDGFLGSVIPPTVQLTYPTGTLANPSGMSSRKPTITWNQNDPQFNNISYQIVYVSDEAGNVIDYGYISVPVADRTKSTGSWTMTVDAPLGAKLQVKVRVMSSSGIYSAWSDIGWMTSNSPPTAVMSNPSGTQTTPTIVSTTRPTLEWNQTDPDIGTLFSHFQIEVTNEANDVIVVDSGIREQNSTLNTGSWELPTDLPAGQKLRVRVRVFDGFVWSSYSPQTWLYINRVPIADFDWTPKPVWEGDMMNSINSSFDPDGDALTYLWTVQEPTGVVKTYTSINFLQKVTEPGDYEVTLTVTDGLLSSTAIKTIIVLPLTIQSEVTYTAQWLIFHNEMGHQTDVIPKSFYSGEIFVVSSQSAPAPVEEVIAWIDTMGLDGQALYVLEKLVPELGDSTMFRGELFDTQFLSFSEGLPRGLQTIHFQITYRNGVIKKEDIPVEIIGNVQQSVGVHRVQ
ncbi:PKD domain-containing protein [Paenibacillus qinlingensis]|uniref:PKD/Chitinase domain-containing protein n=1 Tax=Paenibacillus qinlingensis TaxID=1837343 RepID=A0ABU1NN99_9BACL|nr:PKD domain-containing protein [Paenibacillus qinlingensis]MDR6548949.1 hypothetical protein [Paenibacillus qinlingensis]